MRPAKTDNINVPPYGLPDVAYSIWHDMARVMLLCNEPSALEDCSITRKAETPIELLSIEQPVYQLVLALNPQIRIRSSDSESSSRVMAFLP